eukprot:6211849-Pleurochrysis_carterae.AAC.3
MLVWQRRVDRMRSRLENSAGESVPAAADASHGLPEKVHSKAAVRQSTVGDWRARTLRARSSMSPWRPTPIGRRRPRRDVRRLPRSPRPERPSRSPRRTGRSTANQRRNLPCTHLPCGHAISSVRPQVPRTIEFRPTSTGTVIHATQICPARLESALYALQQ